MSRIDELVAWVRELCQGASDFDPPEPNTEALIAAFRDKTGYLLPTDVQEFYRRCGGAALFAGEPYFLPLSSVEHLDLVALIGAEEQGSITLASWFAFCGTGSGNFYCMVLSPDDDRPQKDIIWCEREELRPSRIVARSFTEFLTRFLDGSLWRGYTLGSATDHGSLTFEPTPAFLRYDTEGFWNNMGPEFGPRTCIEPDCNRLRIANALRCRRHHYEAMLPYRCPFNSSDEEPDRSGRKLLILDLDETLIHATETPLDYPAEFRAGPYHVYKRPGLTRFLDTCFAHFTVGVWTSAAPAFATRVVEQCFRYSSEPAFVWASDRCRWVRDPETDQRTGCKPLSKLTRRGWRKEAILAVDDTPEKWASSYGNFVPVRPYFGELDDDELPRLASYLLTLKDVPNVRNLEKRGWHRG